MYYMVFLVFFVQNVWKAGAFFYNGYPWTLPLTIIGMDGLAMWDMINRWNVPNYYILGEWFQGAIIILYILYPVVLNGINRRPRTTLVCGAVFFLLQIFGEKYDFDHWGLVSDMFLFGCGMAIMKYQILEKRQIILLALCGFAVLMFIELPIERQLLQRIAGLLLFWHYILWGDMIKNFRN